MHVRDEVAVRVRIAGTRKGEFLGQQPIGKSISYQSHEFYRFSEGKSAEEGICSDTVTMLTEIGALSKGALVRSRYWLSRRNHSHFSIASKS